MATLVNFCQTSERSLSAVTKPIFATKHTYITDYHSIVLDYSIFQDNLQDLYTSGLLKQAQHFTEVLDQRKKRHSTNILEDWKTRLDIRKIHRNYANVLPNQI